MHTITIETTINHVRRAKLVKVKKLVRAIVYSEEIIRGGI